MKVMASLLLCTGLAYGQVVEPWTWVNPLPQGNHLRFVTVRPGGEILIGGEGGTLIRSMTQGLNWITAAYPGGLHSLYASTFPTDQIGFVTGDDRFGSGTIIKTTNGGQTWQPLQTNTFAALVDIQFLDSTTGFACGTRGTILRTTDGGAQWDLLQTDRLENVLSVDFRTPLIGTAALEGGRILDTGDGGATWTLRTISATRSVRSIRFNIEGKGLAVGDSGLVLTRALEGGVWTTKQAPTSSSLSAVHWVDARRAIAVGTDGVVAWSTDAGSTWDTTSTDLQTDLSSVGGLDSTHLWLSGQFGALANSTDGGRTWTSTSSGIRTTMHSISSIAGGAAIAVGTGPEIFRKDRADAPWTRLTHDLPTDVQTVTLISDSLVITGGSGGSIYRSTDAGSTWNPITSGVSSSIYASTEQAGVILLVGADGTILRSTDEGMTWSVRPSTITSRIRTVGFASDNVALAAGDGGTILRSVDAGMTWTAGTGPVVTRLTSTCFGDSSNGIIGGAPLGAALPPTVLSTSDGGSTWQTRQITVPPSTDPFAFFTINTIASRSPTEYLAGSIEGTFFRTTNSGQSWTQVLTGTYREVRSLVWSHDRWIAVGALGMIIESPRDTTVVGVQKVARISYPETPILLHAYPNPFNPSTTIEFSSQRTGLTRVIVYDLLGKELGVLFDGDIIAGRAHSVRFDASQVPSGTYIVTVSQGGHQRSRRLLLLK